MSNYNLKRNQPFFTSYYCEVSACEIHRGLPAIFRTAKHLRQNVTWKRVELGFLFLSKGRGSSPSEVRPWTDTKKPQKTGPWTALFQWTSQAQPDVEDVFHFRYLTSKIQPCTSLKPHTTSAFASEQSKTRKKQGKSDCSWQRNLSRETAASQDGCPGGKGGLCTWIFQLLIPAGRATPLFQGNSVHKVTVHKGSRGCHCCPLSLWTPIIPRRHTHHPQGTPHPHTLTYGC